MRHVLLTAVLSLSVLPATTACAVQSQEQVNPEAKVAIDFKERMDKYVDMRKQADDGVPKQGPCDRVMRVHAARCCGSAPGIPCSAVCSLGAIARAAPSSPRRDRVRAARYSPLPEDVNERVSILGENLKVKRPDGDENFVAPGRPIATISNVMIEYRPAPTPPSRKP